MRLVKLYQLGKRIFADDITVEDKKGLIRAVKKLVSGEGEGAGSAKGLDLLGASDFDTELSLKILEEVEHDLGTVVDSKDNFGDADGLESLDLVEDHGLVGKVDEGLGHAEGERAEAGAKAADEDESLHSGGKELGE